MEQMFVMNGLLCPVCRKGVINRFVETNCFVFTSTNDVEINIRVICPYCGEEFIITNERMLSLKGNIVTVYPFHVLDL